MSRGIAIAIDGPAGAGKSTVSKLLAKAANLELLDTGAMYRAFTWAWLNDRALDSSISIEESLEKHHVAIRYVTGSTIVLCDGQDVSSDIREADVTKHVSEVAASPMVRRKAVDLQRELVARAQQSGVGVVLEGRDIGTTVLPQADVKFFLTADAMARASRRAAEMNLDSQQVLVDIEARDRADSQREVSPLRPADDAIHIDATNLSAQEVVTIMLDAIDAHRSI